MAGWPVLLLALESVLQPQLTKDDWQRADAAIVRLAPVEFSDLPAEVRAELDRRGCTVPQPYDSGGQKKNAIRGEFSAPGHTDWAVLCSHQKRSAIVVFHGGQAGKVDAIAEEADSQYLQAVKDGAQIGYSRLISVASTKTVRRRFAKTALRSVIHEGIENLFLGKASVVWYRSGDKWISAPGGD